MFTVYADFNACASDRRIWMDTVGSKKSLEQTGAKPGDWVWLSDDDELKAGGKLEQSEGQILARVAWETLEHIVPDDDELRTPENLQRSWHELSILLGQRNHNYRRILRLLPLFEKALPPGYADSIRAQAALAFGYPDLALHAIEDALIADPTAEEWISFRLDLLLGFDFELARHEAEEMIADPRSSARLLIACIGVLGTVAQHLPEEEARDQYAKMVGLAERFDHAPGREEIASDLVALVHDLKGYALARLDERERALSEFNKAIQENPKASHPYAARGIESYCSDPDQAVRDLLQAVRLGALTFWPSYYLAHHYFLKGEWRSVETFANAALGYAPPKSAAANLYEWLGIAEYEQRGNIDVARNYMLKALQLTPESEHLKENLLRLNRLTPAQQHEAVGWELVLNTQASAADLVVAA